MTHLKAMKLISSELIVVSNVQRDGLDSRV